MKGKILGSRYKIFEYLAEGGFGRTYLAEDTQLPGKDICLVKQLYPSRNDPKFLEIARRLFKTEASTLHNLGHHQQIPKLLAYFEESEKFYLVQQYIKGVTLSKELDSGQIWSESKAIALLQDGLSILQFVHEKRVIHRDIKPDNIIRRESDGKIVLVDFGSVKEVLQEQQTNLGQLTIPVGTQGYMPTEQARGKPLPSSDLYALGMIVIQALTGILPLELPEDDEGEIIWDSARVSPELSAILTRMTLYHFQDRYKSARDVLQALKQLPNAEIATKIQSSTNVQTSITEELSESIEISQPASEIVPNPTFSVNRNDFSGTATKNHALKNISVVNSRATPLKPKSKQINLVILGAIASTVLIGVYWITQQSDAKLNPFPANRLENKQLNPPTKRMKQGEGFRKDI